MTDLCHSVHDIKHTVLTNFRGRHPGTAQVFIRLLQLKFMRDSHISSVYILLKQVAY